MQIFTGLVAGLLLLGLTGTSAFAADHLFTATAAGGLNQTSSQPFLNGTTGPTSNAPTADAVPGQGSPLSGGQSTVPATDTQTGVTTLTTPPAAQMGKTAPSQNSSIIP